jgi:uncharacterized protein UPF0158
MKTLIIDLDDLIMALSTRYELDDPSHYLDLDSGEVVYAGEGLEDLPADLTTNPRYRRIEPVQAEPALHILEAFIAQLTDQQARAQLTAAFQEDEPFEAFKEAMLALPQLRDDWFSFHQQAYAQLAQDWCHRQAIEPQWVQDAA